MNIPNQTNSPILPFNDKVVILLVEDNLINQFAAKHIMKDWNVIIDIAETGTEAVKKYLEGSYDIILMDMYMPEMSGFEATKIIKNEMANNRQPTPLIGLTSVATKEDIKKAQEAGVDDLINKPFEPLKLYELIKKLLGKG